jgi:hypothetical protein
MQPDIVPIGFDFDEAISRKGQKPAQQHQIQERSKKNNKVPLAMDDLKAHQVLRTVRNKDLLHCGCVRQP